MRYTQSEKMQIIKYQTDAFRTWYRRYQDGGFEALANRYRPPRQFWNTVPPWEKQQVVEPALEHPEKSPRDLAWYITDNHRLLNTESPRSCNQLRIHSFFSTGQGPQSDQNS